MAVREKTELLMENEMKPEEGYEGHGHFSQKQMGIW